MKDFIWLKTWIYINIFGIISIDCDRTNIMKKLKGVFVPLECYFRFTKNYAPFMFTGHHGKLLSISIHDIKWKDKYDTPRLEEIPFISIGLFNKFFFNWIWKLPLHLEEHWIDIDDYWEQALWYLYYYDTYSQGLLDKPNIEKAKESWPWINSETKESSWKDKFLIK